MCQNTENSEIYVIKVIDFSDNVSHGIPCELLREISILKELSELGHPNLVKFIDILP